MMGECHGPDGANEPNGPDKSDNFLKKYLPHSAHPHHLAHRPHPPSVIFFKKFHLFCPIRPISPTRSISLIKPISPDFRPESYRLLNQ